MIVIEAGDRIDAHAFLSQSRNDGGEKANRFERRMNRQRNHAAGEFGFEPRLVGLAVLQYERPAFGLVKDKARG